jgi:hypothetical protein
MRDGSSAPQDDDMQGLYYSWIQLLMSLYFICYLLAGGAEPIPPQYSPELGVMEVSVSAAAAAAASANTSAPATASAATEAASEPPSPVEERAAAFAAFPGPAMLRGLVATALATRAAALPSGWASAPHDVAPWHVHTTVLHALTQAEAAASAKLHGVAANPLPLEVRAAAALCRAAAAAGPAVWSSILLSNLPTSSALHSGLRLADLVAAAGASPSLTAASTASGVDAVAAKQLAVSIVKQDESILASLKMLTEGKALLASAPEFHAFSSLLFCLDVSMASNF